MPLEHKHKLKLVGVSDLFLFGYYDFQCEICKKTTRVDRLHFQYLCRVTQYKEAKDI